MREVAGGYQFRTRPEYTEWIRQLMRPAPARISKAALETLAIIAYKQPIIRNDIERIRGVDSGGVIRMLLERKLIRILGRKEIPGRPLIYATTKQFLEAFELKDLKDLPTPKEIDDLGKPSSENIMVQKPLNSLEPSDSENSTIQESSDLLEPSDHKQENPDVPEKSSAENSTIQESLDILKISDHEKEKQMRLKIYLQKMKKFKSL